MSDAHKNDDLSADEMADVGGLVREWRDMLAQARAKGEKEPSLDAFLGCCPSTKAREMFQRMIHERQ